MVIETKLNILKDVQDLAIIKSLGDSNFVYATKPSLKVQRQLYDLSVSNYSDAEIPVFQQYWKFDEQKGIIGSSTFLALRFDKLALRPNGLWLPCLSEAKVIWEQMQRETEERIYRDYGVVIFDEEDPNKNIAKPIASLFKELELNLPLIIPFRILNYNIINSTECRIKINLNLEEKIRSSFKEDVMGKIISGEEAKKYFQFLQKEIQGSYRDWFNDGAKTTYYIYIPEKFSGLYRIVLEKDHEPQEEKIQSLEKSDEMGRTDWICGEAHLNDLEESYNSLVETLIEKMCVDEKIRKQKSFQESLSRL